MHICRLFFRINNNIFPYDYQFVFTFGIEHLASGQLNYSILICCLAPQQYPGFLGAPGGRVTTSGQHSPPSQFKKEDGLQAEAATAAILNLSTHYRKNMEAVAGRPLATSTKVIKLDHLERHLIWSFFKELGFGYKKGRHQKTEFGKGSLAFWWQKDKEVFTP